MAGGSCGTPMGRRSVAIAGDWLMVLSGAIPVVVAVAWLAAVAMAWSVAIWSVVRDRAGRVLW